MMDSSDNERCLPGMGLPKWSKRADKPDFLDYCASPPADGFFYAGQSQQSSKQQTAIGGCVQEVDQLKRGTGGGMGQNIPKLSSAEVVPRQDDAPCYNSESSGFFKSFTPSYLSMNGKEEGSESSTGKAGGIGRVSVTSKVLNMSSSELEGWAKRNIRRQDNMTDTHHPSDDTAPTPVDHIVPKSLPMIKKTRSDEGSALRLVDKGGDTPDSTPCSTPAVTPSCSPQPPRKSGHPFFTGEPSGNKEGSWLFRPAPSDGTNSLMYESTMEIQPQTASQSEKRNVRLVPRPSHLRELNFWSPTSM